MDPEKLQSTLSDAALNDACDMKRAMEMVALLEAQLKDMNPNLDSISEYVTLLCWVSYVCLSKMLKLAYCRYRKKAFVYNERVEELNAATQERDDLKKHYDALRKKRQAGQTSIHIMPFYLFLA